MSSKKGKRERYFTDRSVWQMRLLSIGSLLFCLIVLGTVVLLHTIVDGVHQSLNEQISFSVSLPRETTKSEGAKLRSLLSSKPYIHAVDIISADSALSQIQEEIGEDPVAILGYNPLSPMVRIQLRSAYMHPDSIGAVEAELKSLFPDLSLGYKRDLMDDLRSKTEKVGWVLTIVALVLLVFALMQIRNTMYLMLLSERADIRTLRLVGANAWFVSRPFVLRALLDGLLATALSLSLLGVGVYYLFLEMGLPFSILLGQSYIFLAGIAFLCVGLLFPALLSWRISMRFIYRDEVALRNR